VSKEQIRIIIAAGGTGGHVYPAIAIADEIKKIKSQAEFLFVGTKEKIEARIVPQRGYMLAFIWISGFQRSLTFSNLLFPVKVIVSCVQSFFLIKRFKPDIVIGTGGYACGPVLYIASLLGYPTVVHESNSYPGMTTRMLSSRATKLFTAFEATSGWLKRKDNIERAGTPTRDNLGTISHEDGLHFFHLEPSKKTVLVFGGSLGAASINQAMESIISDLLVSGIQVIWQTGNTGVRLEKIPAKNFWMGKFIDNMEYAYAAADVVICRSGATTLAELTRLGKAAILVPYPFAAADHQTFNAQTLADAGAAIMISDSDLTTRLKTEALSLLNDDVKRQNMCNASRELGRPDAGKEIARKILELID
jgi:UDP-N-acetylglucosamine--N-acetylmuramyl-(pentapeptide) pyrophosphoryl-undecaprenol N-acetylglucosamine transferase